LHISGSGAGAVEALKELFGALFIETMKHYANWLL
jgi:hypothetical protein